MNFTFLEEKQVLGDEQLKIFKEYGVTSEITDFAILLGGESYNGLSSWWTKTPKSNTRATIVTSSGSLSDANVAGVLCVGARPAFKYSKNKKSKKFIFGKTEFELGEYPQTIENDYYSYMLENDFMNEKIMQTDKKYTFDMGFGYWYSDNEEFTEYEYNGEKYVRVRAHKNGKLSDGREVKRGEIYWVKVEPVKWLHDQKTGIVIAKKVLFAGVPFCNDEVYCGNGIETRYKGNFEKSTHICNFMNNCFAKDIIPSKIEPKNKVKPEKDVIITDIDELSPQNEETISDRQDTDIIYQNNEIISDRQDANQKMNLQPTKDYIEKLINEINEELNKIDDNIYVNKIINEVNNLINEYNKSLDEPEKLLEVEGKTYKKIIFQRKLEEMLYNIKNRNKKIKKVKQLKLR